MPKEKLWFQCHFRRSLEGRITETVAYVDEDCAVIGKTIDLNDDDFPGLWEVTNVSGPGVKWEIIGGAETRRRNAGNFPSTSD